MSRSRAALTIAAICSVALLAGSRGPSHAAEAIGAEAVSDEEDSEDAWPPGPPPCFDLVVVARLVKQTYFPLDPLPDGGFTLDAGFYLDLEIERRLAGVESRTRLTVPIARHTEFPSHVKRLLLFLRRSPRGGYGVRGVSSQIVRDTGGRYVMPAARPLSPMDRPYNYLPVNANALLKPIRYDPAQAWWLEKNYLEGEQFCSDGAPARGGGVCSDPYGKGYVEPDLSLYPWGTMKEKWFVADRGLFVSDILKANAERRCSATDPFP
jgi:hypothetical protein